MSDAKKIQSEIDKIQKVYDDPATPKAIKDQLEVALKKAKEKLSSATGKSTPAAAKVVNTQHASKSVKDCQDIIAKYNKERATEHKRVAKRKKEGKPARLTVPEKIGKAAKAVSKKVKADDGTTKTEAKASLAQIVSLVKTLVKGLDKEQRREFLSDVIVEIKELYSDDAVMKASRGAALPGGSPSPEPNRGHGYRMAQMNIFGYKTEDFTHYEKAFFEQVIASPGVEAHAKADVVSMARDIDMLCAIGHNAEDGLRISAPKFLDACRYAMRAMYFAYPVLTNMGDNPPYPTFIPGILESIRVAMARARADIGLHVAAASTHKFAAGGVNDLFKGMNFGPQLTDLFGLVDEMQFELEDGTIMFKGEKEVFDEWIKKLQDTVDRYSVDPGTNAGLAAALENKRLPVYSTAGEHDVPSDEFEARISAGAEPAAAVAGEPIEFLDATGDDLHSAKVALFESADGKYYIQEPGGGKVFNAATRGVFFDSRDAAWAYYERLEKDTKAGGGFVDEPGGDVEPGDFALGGDLGLREKDYLPQEYYESYHLKGKDRKQKYTIFSGPTDDASMRQAARQLFPGMTEQEHRKLAEKYAGLFERAIGEHFQAVDDVFEVELGRKPAIEDRYIVSNINSRTDLSPAAKNRIRGTAFEMYEYQRAWQLHNAMLPKNERVVIRNKKMYGGLISVAAPNNLAMKDNNGEQFLAPSYAKGGPVKFKDKVSAISKRLEGQPVPAAYRKEYGKRYGKKTSREAAQKIAGALAARERADRALRNAKKYLMGGLINIAAPDNLAMKDNNGQQFLAPTV